VLCEIGGTVGDIEAMPFLEAIRQLGNELPRRHCVYIHLTLMPYILGRRTEDQADAAFGEGAAVDRHPAGHPAVRCDRPIPEGERKKLSLFCNVRQSAVIPGLDVGTIYEVPLAYHKEGFDDEVLAAFGIDAAPPPSSTAGRASSTASRTPRAR
jgi:CTP synthase (EC 6.3.4.2)